ncbi:hypothetical protein ACS0TY_023675 [Phlomoides rotata]
MHLLVDLHLPNLKLFMHNHISSAQELEKDVNGPITDSVPAEKKLAIVDKIFAAYNEARICIRNDLVRAASKLFCSMYLYVWTEAQIICRVRAFLNINQGVSWSLIKVFSVH